MGLSGMKRRYSWIQAEGDWVPGLGLRATRSGFTIPVEDSELGLRGKFIGNTRKSLRGT